MFTEKRLKIERYPRGLKRVFCWTKIQGNFAKIQDAVEQHVDLQNGSHRLGNSSIQWADQCQSHVKPHKSKRS